MKLPNKYLLLILISCALTIITQLVYHATSDTGDSASYIFLAKQYSQFNFFTPSYQNAQSGIHLTFLLFLTIFGSIFAYNPIIIGVIQTILFCLSAFFLIKKLEAYLQRDLYVIAILIVLVPEFNVYNGYILSESISYSLLMLAFAIALNIYMHGVSLRNMLFLSFLVGLTVMSRTESVTCIIALIYLLFPKIKKRFLAYTSLLISFPFLIFMLFGFKNYETFHKFKITSYEGGEGLYGGSSENLDGSHHVFYLHKNIFIPKNKIDAIDKIMKMPVEYSVPEQDSFYTRLSIEAWKKDPIQQIGVIPDKLAKNWLLPGFFDIYTNDTTKQRGLQIGKLLSKKYFNNVWYAPYKHLYYMIIHWILLGIIAWGILSIKKQNRFQLAVLMLLLFYFSYAIPLCALPRFHVVLFPLLIITFFPESLVTKINQLTDRFTGKNTTSTSSGKNT